VASVLVMNNPALSFSDCGVVWGTSPNPTINDNAVSLGSGYGRKDTVLTGLQGDFTYYVRGYAYDQYGLTYGQDQSFQVLYNPMQLVGFSSLQITDSIFPGSEDQPIIKLAIETTGLHDALVLRELYGNLATTTDRFDVDWIKIYYTGNDPVFNTTDPFGLPAYPNPNWVVQENTLLADGINYFWICADVDPGATSGNLIDAKVSGYWILPTDYSTITQGDPAGNREVAAMDNVPGTALQFDGINDYVQTDLSDLSGSELTIEYWFKGSINHSTVRQQNGGDYIVAGWNDMHILSNDGGTTAGLPVGDGAEDGNWHHVAFTWKQNTLEGFVSYLDGNIVAARTSSNNPISNISSDLFLGTYIGTGEYMLGSLDEVRIWNKARSSQEIRENMYFPLFGAEQGLKAYWQLNEGAGVQTADKISGYIGTMNNMDNQDWISSSIPFAAGISVANAEANGNVLFTGTGVDIFYHSQSSADVIVTELYSAPNAVPDGQDDVFDEQYWVINRFGAGTFSADVTFQLTEDLNASDESDPTRISLFTRESYSDTDWMLQSFASGVDAANNKAIFPGISNFSQFMITRLQQELSAPQNVDIVVSVTEVQLSWDEVSGANSYKIYSSEDPFEEDWGPPIAVTALESQSFTSSAVKLFYKVTASSNIVTSSAVIKQEVEK
jgi:hypothetical protein